MNCIIIEDQPPAQRILKKYIEDIGSLTLKGTFPDAIQAMDYLKTDKIDLLFLDIHLPKISGIDLLKSVPNLPPVILTTAFSDYALESYEFSVVDYLLKPFSFQRFVKAVSKISSQEPDGQEAAGPHKQTLNNQEIFIKSGYEYIKVAVDDIIYIKSDADYTELFTPARKLLSSESLRSWSEKLDSQQFVRVHKSYVINAAKITKVMGSQIYMTTDAVVPIGRAFRDDFMDRFLT